MPSQLQRYVSKELTHFVGRSFQNDSASESECQERQYGLLLKVLSEQCLGIRFPGPGWVITLATKGGVPFSSNFMYGPKTVCFCDIPVEDLAIHMKKYSRFGVAFRKDYLIAKGVTPVFYVSAGSTITHHSSFIRKANLVTMAEAFDRFFADRRLVETQIRELLNANCGPKVRDACENVLLLNQTLDSLVFANVKFFDPQKDDDDEHHFYMEREWRAPGTVPFELENVSRVFLPSSFVKRFRADMPGYFGQVTFAE